MRGRVVSTAEQWTKSNAEVRSPATAVRHGVMFFSPSSRGPKRAWMKRISDVWSKTSEFTHPPELQGEMTSIGTRGPRPDGPAGKWALPGYISSLRSMVDKPWALVCGGVGGTT